MFFKLLLLGIFLCSYNELAKTQYAPQGHLAYIPAFLVNGSYPVYYNHTGWNGHGYNRTHPIHNRTNSYHNQKVGYPNITVPTKNSHHLIVGTAPSYDYLAYRRLVIKRSSWFGPVTTDVKYRAYRYKSIVAVRAYDQYGNGNGGYASIIEGGVGHDYITIHMRSQKGHGIKFLVEIYAH